jgi:DNA end-binding protein Ku
MSSSLVESMSTDYDPGKYTDEYQEQLQQLIDAKLEAGDDVDTAATFGERPETEDDAGGDVIDLMAALRASVDRNRASRSGGERSGGAADDDEDASTPKRTRSRAATADADTEEPAPRKRAASTTKGSTAKTRASTSHHAKSGGAESDSSGSTAEDDAAPAKKPAAPRSRAKKAS